MLLEASTALLLLDSKRRVGHGDVLFGVGLLVDQQILQSTEDVLALVLHNLGALVLGAPGLFVFDLNGLRVGVVGLLLLFRTEVTVDYVIVVVAQLLVLLDLGFALLHSAELGHAVRVAAVKNAEGTGTDAVAVESWVCSVRRAV